MNFINISMLNPNLYSNCWTIEILQKNHFDGINKGIMFGTSKFLFPTNISRHLLSQFRSCVIYYKT